MTEHFRVAEWQILEWERDYAPLDVRREIVQMNHWLDANPRKAKKKLWKKFVTGWLRREYAKVAHAQVQAQMSRKLDPAGRDYHQKMAVDYSASDLEYYRKFYKEHPELKAGWRGPALEDDDGEKDAVPQSSNGDAGRPLGKLADVREALRSTDSQGHGKNARNETAWFQYREALEP